MIYFVIAQKQEMVNGRPEGQSFDFEHPLGSYHDEYSAVQHAQAHTQNHGVITVVVSEEDLDSFRKAYEDEQQPKTAVTPDPEPEEDDFIGYWGVWNGFLDDNN